MVIMLQFKRNKSVKKASSSEHNKTILSNKRKR